MPENAPTAENASISMRMLMPVGFIRELAKRTGCKNPSQMSSVIALENTASRLWPAIEELARETNPTGFAQWQATQNTAVPAAH